MGAGVHRSDAYAARKVSGGKDKRVGVVEIGFQDKIERQQNDYKYQRSENYFLHQPKTLSSRSHPEFL